LKIEAIKDSILNWLGTTTTSATTEKFVARDKFRKDSKEVKFCGFFGEFKVDFLAGNGKIEDPLGEQKLRYGDLVKSARDLSGEEGNIAIIPELGGEAKAETTLTELYDLLKKQGNGEKEGALLVDGREHIFYIRNIWGFLRAVSVHWNANGWHMCSFVNSFEYPDEWPTGDRVFSRNS
jgi:hypothetical protein